MKQMLTVIAYDQPNVLLRVIQLLSRYRFPLNDLSVKNGEVPGSLEIHALASQDDINTHIIKLLQRLVEVVNVTLESR